MCNLILTLSFILIILSFAARCDNIDPTFTHFKEKQCDISHNCSYPEKVNTHSILIAIDGTGMRKHFEDIEENTDRKYASPIGVNDNHGWIWKSHVANFWEDYQGEAHYFYGPDASEMIIAGNQVSNICITAKDDICNFIKDNFKNGTITSEQIESMTLNQEFGIDIIGYSRGGFAAMEISRKLQYEGCEIDGVNIKPIYVRFLGLYDPVQRDLDWTDWFGDVYDNEKIGDNVIAVSVAKRSPDIHSRSYFGYAVKGFDDDDGYPLYRDMKTFNASHAGCGGVPGEGDCIDHLRLWDIDERLCNYDLYSVSGDKMESANIDIWMRQHAKQVGVPIINEPKDYYNGFTKYSE